jgi:hypothetical protein
MDCEERDRLLDRYLDALYEAESATAPKQVAEIDNWQEVIQQAQRARKQAFDELGYHRKEHGC